MRPTILMASAVLAIAACSGDDNQAQVDGNDAGMNNAMMESNGLATPDETASSAPTAQNGQEYAAMAAASDLYEIESARLASERSENEEIRQLAQMIITDHERSTAELRSAAQQAQPPITVNPQMNQEQQANMQALQAATGEQFDPLYLQQQVLAHQKALNLVQDYAQNGDVPALRQHASTVSGPIQRHLERAQQLSSQGRQ